MREKKHGLPQEQQGRMSRNIACRFTPFSLPQHNLKPVQDRMNGLASSMLRPSEGGKGFLNEGHFSLDGCHDRKHFQGTVGCCKESETSSSARNEAS